jgi:hypothetical protein
MDNEHHPPLGLAPSRLLGTADEPVATMMNKACRSGDIRTGDGELTGCFTGLNYLSRPTAEAIWVTSYRSSTDVTAIRHGSGE